MSCWRRLSFCLMLSSEAITSKHTLISRKKPQRDPQAGPVVDQLDIHLMERRDRFNQAQAKSASRGAAAALQSIKAPRDL